jgi:hydroxymethylpyrimidine pyrophosphatase-like HAD family hydrolase
MDNPRASGRKVVFLDLGLDYSLQGRHGVYPTPGHRARMRRVLTDFGYENIETSGVRLHVLDPGEFVFDRAAKIVFDGDDQAAYEQVRARVSGDFTVVGGTLPGLGMASGEIAPAGVHKAAAIEVVLAALGLTMDDAIAVGDSGNDVEMLLACGVGVAMGNGTAEAKAAADVITESVDEHGLWRAFVRLGLIDASAEPLSGWLAA